MEKVKKLDAIDVKILKILQKNARTTASDIAEAIEMSVPAVSERIRKLEIGDIIERYTLILNNKKLGKELTALMFVSIASPDFTENFNNLIMTESDVLECHYVTGDFDYQLKIITANTSTLEALFFRIKSCGGVEKTSTYIVLSSIKHEFPIELL